jgi:CubicO group peptidase (beta-lactamase class C family)
VELLSYVILALRGWDLMLTSGKFSPYRYAVPEMAADEFETGDMAGEHVDADLIAHLFDRVTTDEFKNIHSLLIVKNGKLIVEEYFSGRTRDGNIQEFNRETLCPQFSVTKSVTATLIGIALDQHLIRSVGEKLHTLLPEYSHTLAEGGTNDICLHHLLSMTAGLAWDESTYPSTDSRNDHFRMSIEADPIRYVLQQPLNSQPGKSFSYNSGLAVVLGEIIHRVSGLRADKFAGRFLFAPLGISEYHWRTYASGTVQTAAGLSLRPRDMAKIGYLYLSGGQWNGNQVVSKEWIREATKQQALALDSFIRKPIPFFLRRLLKQSPIDQNEYGYQWWLGLFRVRGKYIESFMAEGRGGQFIIVVPEVKMVVVTTGWNPDKLGNLQPLRMLQNYILPAVITATAK